MHDLITHQIHRHEPPVSDTPLQIIDETEHYLIVNKPPTIPVHPSGRYRHNTVLFILAKEHSFLNLFPVHRLDRLTSGVLILAKSPQAASSFSTKIASGKCTKTYLAGVRGAFPEKKMVVDKPIQVVNYKLGICRVAEGGKESKTVFELVKTVNNISVIKCIPHTGRTHQIRVHLAHLGFPIINDPLYTDSKNESCELMKENTVEDEAYSSGKNNDIHVGKSVDIRKEMETKEKVKKEEGSEKEASNAETKTNKEKENEKIEICANERKILENKPQKQINKKDTFTTCIDCGQEIPAIKIDRPLFLHAESYNLQEENW
eukprot:CAMPEP_0174266968 /NCGR_PEP_ID=MMETSP0439-20130205/32007_1 /TAXON_ID=0 /ORGANISM="Stereomyxa ramosa, Strain Chinc5" /LENGTH=317 /DNA_ID=CAMNT_0015354241 /DNA_START=429 /DNA_END=1379 /DNA_ORIENTATION=-